MSATTATTTGTPCFPIEAATENGVALIGAYDADVDGPVGSGHVLLSGKDGLQRFRVSKGAARLSHVVATFLDGEDDCGVVPVPEVSDVALRHIATWLQHHEAGLDSMEEIPRPLPGRVEDHIGEWDAKFMYTHLVRGGDEKDNAMLIEVAMGANFMNIKYLLDMCCAGMATIIKGKTTAEIREVLNIENDFTPEEEERIAMENRWCEEQ